MEASHAIAGVGLTLLALASVGGYLLSRRQVISSKTVLRLLSALIFVFVLLYAASAVYTAVIAVKEYS